MAYIPVGTGTPIFEQLCREFAVAGLAHPVYAQARPARRYDALTSPQGPPTQHTYEYFAAEEHDVSQVDTVREPVAASTSWAAEPEPFEAPLFEPPMFDAPLFDAPLVEPPLVEPPLVEPKVSGDHAATDRVGSRYAAPAPPHAAQPHTVQPPTAQPPTAQPAAAQPPAARPPGQAPAMQPPAASSAPVAARASVPVRGRGAHASPADTGPQERVA